MVKWRNNALIDRSKQKGFFRFCICVTVLFMSLGFSALGEAAAEEGQPYELFQDYYKDNVEFINRNDNRYLLPLFMSKQEQPAEGGETIYELSNNALKVQVQTDRFGNLIEKCVITLEVPENMEYGGAGYREFAISGYQSYAFLMAMYPSEDPVQRYALVEDTVKGMEEGMGVYTRQVGAYTLNCLREERTAVLTFQSHRVSLLEAAEGGDLPLGEDEGEGLL